MLYSTARAALKRRSLEGRGTNDLEKSVGVKAAENGIRISSAP